MYSLSVSMLHWNLSWGYELTSCWPAKTAKDHTLSTGLLEKLTTIFYFYFLKQAWTRMMSQWKVACWKLRVLIFGTLKCPLWITQSQEDVTITLLMGKVWPETAWNSDCQGTCHWFSGLPLRSDTEEIHQPSLTQWNQQRQCESSKCNHLKYNRESAEQLH